MNQKISRSRALVRLKVAAVDALDLERAKEGFCRSIIITAAFAAHAGQDAVRLEQLTVGATGILHAPIGMMDQALRGLAVPQGHRQGGSDQFGAQVMGKGPADNAPAVK